MKSPRWILAIGVGAVLTAGGAVTYAAAADAGTRPDTCTVSMRSHLQVVDGSGAACQTAVGLVLKAGNR
jgi:hypothetical protein